tara:strand:+ start:1685 stop:2233 length:549 start_codon:yes stop_codon:yes gene_type:complete
MQVAMMSSSPCDEMLLHKKRQNQQAMCRGEFHQKNILTKYEKEKEELEDMITNLIQNEHPTCLLDWNDGHNVHLTVSQCFDMNSNLYITGSKQSKKLQKKYLEYQKVTSKVSHARKGVEQAKEHCKKQERMAKNIMVLTPDSSDENVSTGERSSEDDWREGPQPEQEANDDDVPESWEDLLF